MFPGFEDPDFMGRRISEWEKGQDFILVQMHIYMWTSFYMQLDVFTAALYSIKY